MHYMQAMGMMNAVWHIRGKVALKDLSAPCDAILDHIQLMLDQEGLSSARPEKNHIQFSRYFFEGRWLPKNKCISLCDHGEFWIEGDVAGNALHYDLRLFRCFVTFLCGSLLFGMIPFERNRLLIGPAVAIIGFVWVYGGNLLIAHFELRRFIRATGAR